MAQSLENAYFSLAIRSLLIRSPASLILESTYCVATYPTPTTPSPIANVDRLRRSHLRVAEIMLHSIQSVRDISIQCPHNCYGVAVVEFHVILYVREQVIRPLIPRPKWLERTPCQESAYLVALSIRTWGGCGGAHVAKCPLSASTFHCASRS